MRPLLLLLLSALAAASPHETRWPNGKLKEKGAISNGKKHGMWQTWYEDGTPQSAGSYDRGEREGLWKTWHKNGARESEVEYEDGRLHGACAWWHDNGQLRRSFEHRKGKPWDGILIEYHRNGAVWSKLKYVKGKGPNQRQVAWHDNGVKMYEGNWRNELQDGKWTYWYRSGKKRKVIHYSKGRPHGWVTEWDEKGNVLRREKWKRGKRDDG